jgi:hypothetical protein
MKTLVIHRWVAITSVSLFTAACGLYGNQAPESPKPELDESPLTSKKAKVEASSKGDTAKEPRQKPREVGDYFVHRFTGTYRQTPLTLTEKVIAEEDGVWVVDYTLEEGEASFTLRARLAKDTGHVVRVSEIDGENEIDAPVSTYNDLLTKTLFAPDVNEALIDERPEVCLVGPDELECETKNYRVYVGDKEAVLSVTQSEELPGRDIAGEVIGIDGSVIYRAELVESGKDKPRPTVAQIPEEYRD